MVSAATPTESWPNQKPNEISTKLSFFNSFVFSLLQMGRLFTAIDFVYIVQTIEIYFVVDFALHIRFERNSAGEKWFSGREYNEIWKIPWDPLSREKTTFIFIKWQALDYYYYYYFRGDASRCLNFIRKKKSNSTWPKKFSFFFTHKKNEQGKYDISVHGAHGWSLVCALFMPCYS